MPERQCESTVAIATDTITVDEPFRLKKVLVIRTNGCKVANVEVRRSGLASLVITLGYDKKLLLLSQSLQE